MDTLPLAIANGWGCGISAYGGLSRSNAEPP
jgi:hypothetical protein